MNRAAELLGLSADCALPAQSDGLIELGARVVFGTHWCARRSTAPRIRAIAAPPIEPSPKRPTRRSTRTVARGIGTRGDWADEAVAFELERSAGRAQVRGGTDRGSGLPGPGRRAHAGPRTTRRPARLRPPRRRAAASAPEAAGELLDVAELAPLDDVQRGRLAQLQARLLFGRSRGSGSAPTLLESVTQFADTATQLGALDSRLAGEAHLDAVNAAMYVGRLGGPDLVGATAAAAAAALRGVTSERLVDLVVYALATRLVHGPSAALPELRAACTAMTAENWVWQAFPMAHEALVHDSWDDEAWYRLSGEAVRIATEAGALEVLPRALVSRAGMHVQAGEFGTARQLIAEADEISEAAGVAPVRYHRLALLAWTGDEAETMRQVGATVRDGAARGEGRVFGIAGYVTAVLYNGLGRYQTALDAVLESCTYEDTGIYAWSLIELVEAAARADQRETALVALETLTVRTTAAGTDWALASGARSRALLLDGPAAEDLHVEAIERFERTRIAVHLARARLLYGEWLRRQNRRSDARIQLRMAHESFTRMGAGAFAERTRRELSATGEKTRKREVPRGTAHAAGTADRATGGGGPDEPGDRRAALHQRAHRRMAPAQDLREAVDPLAPGTA